MNTTLETLPAQTTERAIMNKKPVLHRENVKTIITANSKAFEEKKLCDGLTFNLGDACAFSCEYCYVEAQMRKLVKPIIDKKNTEDGKSYEFKDVVVRRKNAINVLREQLTDPKEKKLLGDTTTKRVIYSSTLVDVAANMKLLNETAEACNLILEHTNWDIRLLTKSALIHKLIEDELIPKAHHKRLILGVSVGTLDDKLAKAIETGTALVSKRLESLHWLQDNGYRTFGMICPSLPQEDYATFSKAMCEAIRIEKCEHVWAEVINVRGESMTRTLQALKTAGFEAEALRMESVSGPENASKWEDYAKATFNAHKENISPAKLRFLQYVKKDSMAWWKAQEPNGAVLLGKLAEAASGKSKDKVASAEVVTPNTEDIEYRNVREKTVSEAVSASMAAGRALFEIFTYKDGILWNTDHGSFEAYCDAKWGYARSHAYRLRNYGSFINLVERLNKSNSPKGEAGIAIPLNESQIRPILRIPAKNRIEAWKAATEGEKITDLTAATIENKVSKYAKPMPGKVKDAATAPVVTDVKDEPTALLTKLEASLEAHVKAAEIKKLVEQIRVIVAEPIEAKPIEAPLAVAA